MTLAQIFLVIGVAQGLFLILVLLIRKRHKHQEGHSFLVAVIASLTLSVFCQLIFDSRQYHAFPHIAVIMSGVLFLIGPLLYLYVRRVMYGNPLTVLSGLNLLPFIINTVFLLSIILPLSADGLNQGLDESYESRAGTAGISLYTWIKLLHLVLYGWLIILLIYRHERQLKNNLSNIDLVRLRWVKFMLYGYMLLIMIPVTKILSDYFLWFEFENADIAATLYVAFWIFAISYFWMQEPVVFSRVPDLAQEARYSSSALTEEKSLDLLTRLQNIMKEKKPFLNPSLTLSDLAMQLSARPHYLSQVINERLGLCFFDFVNQYRVEEFKRLFHNKSMQSFTILAIAFETGFNNKVSFNKAFKKFTGLTPSGYLNKISKS
jgi:AraC-like DNA-binding protein